MKLEKQDIISVYKSDSTVRSVADYLAANDSSVRLKGLAGSADAMVCAAVRSLMPDPHLVILHDREEAVYFQNDLQNILPDTDKCKLFPTSHKKPYQFDEIENANVLQRAEVLTLVNKPGNQDYIIVSYPEALTEKVINKRSLVEHTFGAAVGEKFDVEFLTEFLESYDFERVEFVYEAGQYSVRGGIIDVFSFSRDYPCRIELFGDEIESIRLFDPESQLSSDSVNEINIIPNIQTKLLQEERQSFLDFVPKETIIWIKDYREAIDIIDKSFEKASQSFDSLMELSAHTQVISDPGFLFEDIDSFQKSLGSLRIVEFGKRFYLQTKGEFNFEFKPQPNFNKNFDLLVENIQSLQDDGFRSAILSDSYPQLERLATIFEEINAEVKFDPIKGGLREGFIDNLNRVAFYTDHQIFDRFHLVRSKSKFNKKKALTLKELKTLQTGDYVVHIDHGVARFAGLDTVEVNGNAQEAMRLVYRDDDLLYVSIHALHKISKYSGKEGEPTAVNKLGSPEWENKKKKVKRKVKDIAKDLIELYAKRKAAPGFRYPPDNFLQAELESSFLYEDTPDQSTSTSDVKKDMELAHPMDRLVCGDVGFGKTEVAIRAAFKAVDAGKQVAVLVPTTILAMQHHNTFRARLANFPIVVDYINRFKSAKEVSRTKKELKEGKIDILIGTHRLVNKDLEFKDLGLLVVDEEQKFGVKVKERIKEMRVNVDALTLTATPIPRTLHFSLMGARDLSIISTPPPNRRPVTTEVSEFREEIIRDAISHEIRRGGQVFFVHNRISDIEQIANTVYKLVPDAKIGIAHGQMEGRLLEKVMMKFINGEYDVLVSTNIIESGLDIPNANTIIINRAHMFGLSDLHQMRGRVGRSNTKAYCYLLTPPSSVLTSDARKRLITLEEFSELGDGFKVAMRDLDIRGAGNLLGSEQSGFINDIGFDMYHKILDEAVSELKENEFQQIFENELLKSENLQVIRQDCIIETDLEIIIPNEYVANTAERLHLYSTLDNINSDSELTDFVNGLRDRFGELPNSVNELVKSVKLRWLGIQLGFEKISLKNGEMKCYISEEKEENYFQSDTFGNIIKFVQKHPLRCKMKEYKKRLIITVYDVMEVDNAVDALSEMEAIPV